MISLVYVTPCKPLVMIICFLFHLVTWSNVLSYHLSHLHVCLAFSFLCNFHMLTCYGYTRSLSLHLLGKSRSYFYLSFLSFIIYPSSFVIFIISHVYYFSCLLFIIFIIYLFVQSLAIRSVGLHTYNHFFPSSVGEKQK